ncbi:Hydra magnipapillata [Nesidiocoris tenuis]|uniref:Hydra magnipapillata n=1 Tax=Nesidiocoris tenuis TaxID=355587 RepID=A0ABN7ACF9_9HEMI|nr:Hydra magnipapillata [Nesidiocoris tenuis]
MDLGKLKVGILDGRENWATWRYKICALLRGIPGAIDILEGRKVMPVPPEGECSQNDTDKFEKELEKFVTTESNALTAILANVSDETIQKIMRFTKARDVWQELHRLFDGSEEDKAYDLCLQFFNYQRDEEDDVSTHMSKLKNLWEKLKTEISKEKPCELPDIFLICKILGTLSDDFFSFKSSWLLMTKNERTIETLTNQLCAYERALQNKDSGRNQQEVLATTKTKVFNKNKAEKGKEFCKYCKQVGHTIKKCQKWKNDGRPPKPANDKQDREKTNSAKTEKIQGSRMMLNVEMNSLGSNISDYWYLDSGATNHVTHNADFFISFERFSIEKQVVTADGKPVKAIGKGSILVKSFVNGRAEEIELTDVWYVPGIKKNLFSTLATQDKHPHSTFYSSTESCTLNINGRVVVRGSRKRNGGLYKLSLKNEIPAKQPEVNLLNKPDLLQIYHERLGHQNKRHVKSVIERELGVKLNLDSELCEGCIYGKAHRQKFGKRERANNPGDLIHSDVVGPFSKSRSGFQYYVVFKDDYSRYRYVYFMRHKSEVASKLRIMLAEASALGHVVKELLTDNGGEYICESVRKILQEPCKTL